MSSEKDAVSYSRFLHITVDALKAGKFFSRFKDDGSHKFIGDVSDIKTWRVNFKTQGTNQ